MAVTTCPPGAWTDIPATGGSDMLLEARGTGFYVDTSGTKPADPSEGYALAGMESMVISTGTPVAVQPAQPVVPVRAYSHPI